MAEIEWRDLEEHPRDNRLYLFAWPMGSTSWGPVLLDGKPWNFSTGYWGEKDDDPHDGDYRALPGPTKWAEIPCPT